MDNIKRWLVYIIRFGRIVGRLLGGFGITALSVQQQSRLKLPCDLDAYFEDC